MNNLTDRTADLLLALADLYVPNYMRFQVDDVIIGRYVNDDPKFGWYFSRKVAGKEFISQFRTPEALVEGLLDSGLFTGPELLQAVIEQVEFRIEQTGNAVTD